MACKRPGNSQPSNMPLLETAGVILLGFLLGSIPTAYLVGRWWRGTDIRGLGSGNPGATNIGREIGVVPGIVVLVIDSVKGALAIFIGQWLDVPAVTLYFAALLAVIGHNFSPFIGFRGGKGAATVLGISMLMLWQITAISGAVGLLILAATRHSVLAMTGVFIALNALTIATVQPAGQIILCLVLSLLVAGTHFGRQRAQLIPALASRDWRRFMSID